MYFLDSHSSLISIAIEKTNLINESLFGNTHIFLVLPFNSLLNLSVILFVCDKNNYATMVNFDYASLDIIQSHSSIHYNISDSYIHW